MSLVQPHSSGHGYISFQTEDEGEDRVRPSYPPAIYDRLVQVKNRYYPDNMFRSSKNIKPSIDTHRRDGLAASSNN